MSVAMLQAAPDSQYQIVALLATPQQNMKITWLDSTSIYTSDYPIKSYATLEINNSKSATDGDKYSYNGQFSYESQGVQGSVQLSNKYASTITAGLANTFTTNSNDHPPLSILSAESLLYNGLGTFPISNSFYLTALSIDSSVGMVIPKNTIPIAAVTSSSIAAQPALFLDFSANPTQAVCFNDDNNQFEPCS